MKSKTSFTGCGKRIVIKPCRSRALIYSKLCIYLSAFILLCFVDLNLWILSFIAGLLVLSMWLIIASPGDGLISLSLQTGMPLLLQHQNQTAWDSVTVTESFVTSWLIALKVRSLNSSSRYSIVYPADSINKVSYRRLAVYLNHLDQ